MSNNSRENERQAILKRHQIVENTPQEEKIVRLLKDSLVSTEWAKETFSDFKKFLVDYFKDSLQHIDDEDYIHNKTQDLLSRVALRGNAKIISGKEYLDEVDRNSPIFLLINHLGLYKLATIDPINELGLDDVGVDKMYSLPLFHASCEPVAKALNDNLYIAAFEFPEEIGKIQKFAGGVVIRLEDEEKLLNDSASGIDLLLTRTKKFMEEHPAGALCLLPEGKTSGKKNGVSPYDLEVFKTGSFVVASKLGVPILPISQYFDPNTGFEVAVHKPVKLPDNLSREEFRKIADSTRDTMQKWLDERQSQSK